MKSLIACVFGALVLAFFANAKAQSRPQIDNGDLYMIMNYAAGYANSPISFSIDSTKTSCDCRAKTEEPIGKKAVYNCEIQSLQDQLRSNSSKFQAGQKMTMILKSKPESSHWDLIEIDHMERDYIKDDQTREPYRSRDLQLENSDSLTFTRWEALYGLRRLKMKSLSDEAATLTYEEGNLKNHLLSEGIDPSDRILAELHCTRVKDSNTQAR